MEMFLTGFLTMHSVASPPRGPVMWHIASRLRQPNYPNQLAPKRGSQSSLILDPNLRWWANGGNLSIVQAGDTLSRGGLISALFSPAFDRTFDHMQLIRATLIFKMQEDL